MGSKLWCFLFFLGTCVGTHFTVTVNDTTSLNLTDPEPDTRRFCGLPQNATSVNDCDWLEYLNQSAEANIGAFVVAGVLLIVTILYWFSVCCCRPCREPDVCIGCGELNTLTKGLIMLIIVSVTVGGAIVFIFGHYNPNLLDDTLDYVDTKFTRAIEFGNYLVNTSDVLSVKYGISVDTAEIENAVSLIQSGLDDYKTYNDAAKLGYTIIMAVVFSVSVLLAIIIFFYPLKSWRPILYLYIMIGIVVLFGLSVYIAGVGWEKVLQDDVCAETLYNEGFFTLLTYDFPSIVVSTMDDIDSYVHDKETDVCSAVAQARITTPTCCGGLQTPCGSERFCCDETDPSLYVNSTIRDGATTHVVRDCINTCTTSSLRQLSTAIDTLTSMEFDVYDLTNQTQIFLNEFSENTIREELNGIFCDSNHVILYAGIAILVTGLYLNLWAAVLMRDRDMDNGTTCCCCRGHENRV